MDFAPIRPARPRAESIVPMINVVFLLQIFFLMTAQIAPPDPVDVTPPEASAEAAVRQPGILFIGPDGTPYFNGAIGDAALAALEGRDDAPLPIRADAALPAADLAALLPRLAAAGVSQIDLLTVQP
ncbi:biopolymer transporter ExbD [Loktanella sp. IMCC34160]|uniref:ExbD/TolR family protein n=1 Tax=Loktanella sp. IMCC34160 TaxID=2510646 RepID=UPI00101E13E8|nr:biopolymer transporter ExbD [Loktanella sp. IMCC34160]RYG90752.1 biopolymer transporter ExbD [Loktanella sp. IMCC34160]